MIVLDASVLIGHLDGRDAHHREARALLEASGGVPLGASSITLAETLVPPARAGRSEEARRALDLLGVAELELGSGAPARLAALRAETGRKLPDCCVLLVARDREAAVASFDVGLVRAAEELGLGVFDSK